MRIGDIVFIQGYPVYHYVVLEEAEMKELLDYELEIVEIWNHEFSKAAEWVLNAIQRYEYYFDKECKEYNKSFFKSNKPLNCPDMDLETGEYLDTYGGMPL